MIEIRLLGDFALRHDGAVLAPWRRAAPRRLFKLLLAARSHTLAVPQVAAMFWPGEHAAPVRQRLHHLSYLLRTALEELSRHLPAAAVPLGVELRDDVLRLTGASSLHIDADAFEAALDAALAVPPADIEALQALHALQEALALYGGPLLPGESAGEGWEDWLRTRREQLHRRHLQGLHTLARWQAEAGRSAEATDSWQRVLAAEPTDEAACRALMDLCAALGRREQVERLYTDCKAALAQSLGVPPSAATHQAYRRAMLGPDLAAHGEAAAAGVAERNEASATERFCPPVPLVALIGRDALVDTVLERLREPGVRHLGLLGAGGIGKTQLALRVAHEMAPTLAHGACFVALEEVGPDGVLDRLRRALRLSEVPRQATIDAAIGLLEDKTMLLVLDNCEHVAAELGFIATLLSRCPGLKLLTTSRLPLNQRTEQIVQVSGLPATPEAAVRLFVERARAAAPAFQPDAVAPEVLAAITQRLDGLPLAIELVAARVRVFAPAELLAQLEESHSAASGGGPDRPVRHRSLEASFAWSHDLLTSPARVALGRAVLFLAPFELAAWAAVCEQPHATMIDLVQSLVELGLVHRTAALLRPGTERPPGDERFQLHASARHLLRDNDDVQGGHRPFLRWFTQRAEALDGELSGARAAQAMAGFEADHENHFAALRLARGRGDAQALAALVRSLARYWSRSGAWSRADAWVEQAVQDAVALAAPERCTTWLAASSYWIDSHRDERAMALLRATMALADTAADGVAHAQAAISFAGLACQHGAAADAVAPLEAALTEAQAAGREDLLRAARNNLALCCLNEGRLERAESLWHACDQADGPAGPQARVAPNFNLALLAHYRGRRAEARRRMALARGLECAAAPRPVRLAQLLVRESWMQACHGQAAEAAHSLQAAREVAASARLATWLQACAAQQGKLDLLRGDAQAAAARLEACLLPGRAPLPTWDRLDLRMWLVQAHLGLTGHEDEARAVLLALLGEMGAGWRHEVPRVLELASAWFVQDGQADAAERAWTEAQALRSAQGTKRFGVDEAHARRLRIRLRTRGTSGAPSGSRPVDVAPADPPLAWVAARLSA